MIAAARLSSHLPRPGLPAPGAPAMVAESEDTLDTAFEIGWDHARYGLTPPLETWCSHQRLQQGFRAGRTAVGRRTRTADRHVQAWLALRLHALRHRLTFETVQLTPNFLAQIEVAHCPVTRQRLTDRLGTANDRCIVRLRRDAGFAAGHLAMVSLRAHRARAALGRAGLLQRQRSCDAGSQVLDGLDASQWSRWAALCSLTEALDHAQAARLPLCVLPPSRLRLFNPVQALQTLASRALLPSSGTAGLLGALRDHLPAPARQGFDTWLSSYQLEVEAERSRQLCALPPWALEDAWQVREVQQRWQDFALRLGPRQCEALVLECGQGRTRWLPDEAATDGWALEQGGMRPLQPPFQLPAIPPRRRQLGLFDRTC